MVWETVKKEMTITKLLLAIIAILLCCFLTFGLSHGSEKNKANNEQGLEMLNMFRKYLEKNESHPEHPQAVPGIMPTPSPKTRKFYSISPSVQKSDSHSKHVTPLVHSTNTSTNKSEPKLDLVLVVDVKDQPKHEEPKILDVKNTGTKHVDEVVLNRVLFSKTVRVSKVEEVFEDLVAQNVRRIIKEDRAERIEISRNKEMETIANELGIKDLISL